MRIGFFLIFFVCQLIPNIEAQKRDSLRFSIDVSAGYSLPFGNYSKSDSLALVNSKNYQGYAKAGWNINVKAGYRITNRLGLMTQLVYNVNGFNSSGLHVNSSPNELYIISGSNYYVGSYLIGPFVNFNIGNKFEIGVHVLCGLMTVDYSKISYTPGNSFTIKQLPAVLTFQPDRSSSVAYDFGTSVKWKMTNQLRTLFSIDYLGGMSSFAGYTYLNNNASSPGHASANGHFDIDKETMSIGLLNINIGIVLNL